MDQILFSSSVFLGCFPSSVAYTPVTLSLEISLLPWPLVFLRVSSAFDVPTAYIQAEIV